MTQDITTVMHVASLQDLDDIVTLYQATWREELPQYIIPDHPGYDTGAAHYISTLFNVPAIKTLVVRFLGACAGVIMFDPHFVNPLLLQKECYIYEWFVSKDYRGSRIPYRLWRAMEDSALENTCIRLRAMTSNAHVIDLMKRIGGTIDAVMLVKEL